MRGILLANSRWLLALSRRVALLFLSAELPPCAIPLGQGWGSELFGGRLGAELSIPGKQRGLSRAWCGCQGRGWILPWPRVPVGGRCRAPSSGCPLLQPQPRHPDVPPSALCSERCGSHGCVKTCAYCGEGERGGKERKRLMP